MSKTSPGIETPSRPRGRPMKEGLPEHLLLHTLQVLLRDGYDRFSMAAVAKSASTSKETLYRHFQDKAGLLGAALDHLGKSVEPLLLEGIHLEGIHEDLERGARLQRLAENYLKGCLRPESLALQRIAYLEAGKDLGQVFARQFTDTALAVMTRQFSMLKTPEPKLDAEIFLAMVQGQLHERALLGAAPEPTAKRIREMTAHAVKVFLAYLER